MPSLPELLERDEELAALAAAVDIAVGGSGSLTAAVGSAGIGKTRLLAEAAQVASKAGFEVYAARGSELEQDFAFGLVRQLYEPSLVRMDPSARDEVLAGAAGNAAAVVLADTAGGRGSTGDFAVLHGLFWLTANLCERTPIALILDDLHWADTASLRFLAYLLPRLEDLPVAVTVASRPNAQSAAPHVLDQIVTDPGCRILRPAALTEEASGKLIQRALSDDAAPGFLSACHSATQGNPLLLHDLAATFRSEGLIPSADNVGMVDVLGPRAVAQRVSLWLNRLPPACAALARAVSVLGDGTSLHHAAALARLSADDAVRAARNLERADLFRSDYATNRADVVQRVQFSHPLVRATVYEGMDPADRVDAHRRAARLLTERHSAPEHIASHLLRVPPAQDDAVVDVLRSAAADAFAHGSPDTAATHLRRCLAEPPAGDIRADVQRELGQVMTLVDTNAAATELRAALTLAVSPRSRAEIAVLLSTALVFLVRFDEAERVCLDALAELSADDTDLRSKLEANLLLIPILQPGRADLAERRHFARAMSGQPNLGSRALDCLLAAHGAWRSDPASVALALQGLGGGELAGHVYPETAAAPCGWLVLITADRDEVFASIDSAVARAHQNGSVHGLTTALTLRGLAWLWRGQLAEAEAEILEAIQSADAARFELATFLANCFLADIMMERGRLDEAQAALDALGLPDPVPPVGPLFWYLDSRARLLRRQGRIEEALDTALATGRRFGMHDGDNAGFLAWRPEAAICAHLLGRGEQARVLAEEDLRLARKWQAPRALGRALRVSGTVTGGSQGIELFREAVTVLEPSPARLEYANALVELGSALRRSGARVKARHPLTLAMEVADVCGADPLRDQARSELRATGVRPRRVGPAGPDSLTPSERRVAELAMAGHSNRRIAQQLFVTVKTVEVHLTSAYRKVGVSDRNQLAEALSGVRPS